MDQKKTLRSIPQNKLSLKKQCPVLREPLLKGKLELAAYGPLMTSTMCQKYGKNFTPRSNSLYSHKDPGGISQRDETTLQKKVVSQNLYDFIVSHSECEDLSSKERYQQLKIQIFDQLLSQSSSKELIVHNNNQKGIIMIEPNPYLQPYDKNKQTLKYETCRKSQIDGSLILFTNYMKRIHHRKEHLIKLVSKSAVQEIAKPKTNLTNSFNRNLKRKIIKNLLKRAKVSDQAIYPPTLLQDFQLCSDKDTHYTRSNKSLNDVFNTTFNSTSSYHMGRKGNSKEGDPNDSANVNYPYLQSATTSFRDFGTPINMSNRNRRNHTSESKRIQSSSMKNQHFQFYNLNNTADKSPLDNDQGLSFDRGLNSHLSSHTNKSQQRQHQGVPTEDQDKSLINRRKYLSGQQASQLSSNSNTNPNLQSQSKDQAASNLEICNNRYRMNNYGLSTQEKNEMEGLNNFERPSTQKNGRNHDRNNSNQHNKPKILIHSSLKPNEKRNNSTDQCQSSTSDTKGVLLHNKVQTQENHWVKQMKLPDEIPKMKVEMSDFIKCLSIDDIISDDDDMLDQNSQRGQGEQSEQLEQLEQSKRESKQVEVANVPDLKDQNENDQNITDDVVIDSQPNNHTSSIDRENYSTYRGSGYDSQMNMQSIWNKKENISKKTVQNKTFQFKTEKKKTAESVVGQTLIKEKVEQKNKTKGEFSNQISQSNNQSYNIEQIQKNAIQTEKLFNNAYQNQQFYSYDEENDQNESSSQINQECGSKRQTLSLIYQNRLLALSKTQYTSKTNYLKQKSHSFYYNK